MALPKPSKAYLDLTGQNERDHSSAAQPSQHSGGRPSCPAHLSPGAKREWRRVVKILTERGTITRGDGPCIETYVEMVLRWRKALAEIDARGLFIDEHRGSPGGGEWITRVENPAARMAQKLEAAIRQYQKEIGITPAARERTKKVQAGRTAKNVIPGSMADLMARHAEGEDE